MDRNATRRKRYAEMPQHLRDDMLRRRREKYAEQRAQSSPVHVPSPIVRQLRKSEQNRRGYLSRSRIDASGAALSRPVNQPLASAAIQPSTNISDLSQRPISSVPSPQPSLLPPGVSGSFVSHKCPFCLAAARPGSSPASPVQQGRPARGSKPSIAKWSRLEKIPTKPLTLPNVPHCQHCGAKKFYLEPPGFCCSNGGVSLVQHALPYDLVRLFTGTDEESTEFQRNIRTINNNLAFTTFAAKYDRNLTKNSHGIYTFRVQGQVYHLLSSLSPSASPPTGIQLLFYDYDEELSLRLRDSPRLRGSTLEFLMHVLKRNPYTRFFRSLRDVPQLEKHRIILNSDPGLDQRVYNLPATSQVAAIWTESDDQDLEKNVHIQVYSHSSSSHRIQHYYACYDPLQYPLLFPRGESGWHHGIPKKPAPPKRKRKPDAEDMLDFSHIEGPSDLIALENTGIFKCLNNYSIVSTPCPLVLLLNQFLPPLIFPAVAEEGKAKRDTVSAREYYCYKFQIREDDRSMLLHARRLLQQFSVDVYVKIETSRLNFHRNKQREVRSEILKGVIDGMSTGCSTGNDVGRRIYLPASFIGGPRDMRRRYLDAMALVQKFGKPDLFLTMTCNTMWKEIQDNLKYEEKAQDRPDLVARVFRAKFEVLRSEIIKKKLFGEVAAFVYVIEHQKRGLPHAHMLVILKPDAKPLNPDAYDRIVSAELPDPTEQSYLYSLVIKHMMHGPCGSLNKENVCMRNGMCKNHYPKDYLEQTTHSEDSYPHYRRRRNNRFVRVRNHCLDNRWVVPYTPYLLALIDCHLNVEICSTIKLVKYLYKYVYKGHDRVSFHIHSEDAPEDIDEIHEFQSARWVAAAEAMWRIYRFPISEMSPSVYTLQLHLPGEQMVSFHRNSNLSDLINSTDFSKTMLTEFFSMNRRSKQTRMLKCLYRDFPQYFVWHSDKKKWTRRKRRKVIGRVVAVNPSEGERYFLRLLLSHIRAPKSFNHLLTVNGQVSSSYREAAFRMGLLQSDAYIEDTLAEASAFHMPWSLRALFSMLLVFCTPSNPISLWEKYERDLSSDFERNGIANGHDPSYIRRCVLQDINRSLEQMGRRIGDYHLVPDDDLFTDHERFAKEIESERNIPFADNDLLTVYQLNVGQQAAYNAIMSDIYSPDSKSFFVDGPGGTGKTFLYRALLTTLRTQGHIALAVASSGVAASILPGGRTAHSRFKIPLDASSTKTCQISKQNSTAKLIVMAKLILWDEASMAKRDTIEAFDLLLKDIMDSDKPFGGKVVVFGGDFRQTLPVIQNATRDIQVQASFVNSTLWGSLQKITLTENMRAFLDKPFSEFLLRVGEGTEPEDEDGRISLANDILVPYDSKDASLDRLIGSVFSDLRLYSLDPYLMINRCILSAMNSAVDDVNQMIINRFPGQPYTYTSTDRTLNERDQGDYEDFLNSLNPKGLPPHKLILKDNCPVILLRNLNPAEGLCNGTRLICRELGKNTICVEIAVGQHRGKKVLLPRIPLQSADSEKNGIPFKRTQFPIKLCFAMTINKSQGQTLDYVGIYLREPVFSHGQLYVALSRAKTSTSVKVLIVPGTYSDSVTCCKTRNVVYREVLQLSKPMSELLQIADVKPKMLNWTAKVFVKEKMHPGSGKTSPTRYQKFVLSDSEGSRVQGILFNNAIEKMGPKLQLYKKYRITNAEVREIDKKYQFDGITIQWVISTRTVVEEDTDEDGSVLPFHFDYTPFKDFPLFVDSKSKTVDVLGVVIDVQSAVPIKLQSQDSYVQRFVIINEE
ncbi:uncharacterized protein [Coffea arabica]|uniref:ATP-dependent DNA helicase n=1 Tax=Coffea arabica TaxID=13443 RepID=A0ABM4W346_COFAR